MDGDINFVIPQKLEDLSTFSRHKYVVNIDYNAEEVNEKIPGEYFVNVTKLPMLMQSPLSSTLSRSLGSRT